jgi:hypothetical protein
MLPNKRYCNIIKKGMFVSHQGVSLCCINPDKHNIKPSEFWFGNIRKEALEKIEKKEKVKGCDECYHKEENNMSSSRTLYHSYNHILVKELPTMLDLDFSNFCNLKCVMCSPTRSSEWAKETKKDIDSISKISIDLIEDLATISDNVVEINLQGGEPSIMKEYEYYFDLLNKKSILKNINLQVITNITNVNTRFYDMLKHFKNVRLGVSIDAFGKANNYIRWPSKFEQIEKNLIKLSNLDNNVKVEILNSLNILSMFNYKDFLFWCKKIESIFAEKNKYFGVVPMNVTDPIKYSPFIAPYSLKEKFIKDVKNFLKEETLNQNSKFRTEISLLLMSLNKNETNYAVLDELKNTIKKLDTQRNTNIEEFIPEFSNYI